MAYKNTKNTISVRIDKIPYNRFKEFCEDKGLIAPKQIGFILEGLLQEELFDLLKAGWKIVEQRKIKGLKDANSEDNEVKNGS